MKERETMIASASFAAGWDAALGAARKAVAGLAKETFCDSAPCWGSERYIAAIDSLRDES